MIGAGVATAAVRRDVGKLPVLTLRCGGVTRGDRRNQRGVLDLVTAPVDQRARICGRSSDSRVIDRLTLTVTKVRPGLGDG